MIHFSLTGSAHYLPRTSNLSHAPVAHAKTRAILTTRADARSCRAVTTTGLNAHFSRNLFISECCVCCQRNSHINLEKRKEEKVHRMALNVLSTLATAPQISVSSLAITRKQCIQHRQEVQEYIFQITHKMCSLKISYRLINQCIFCPNYR